MATTKLLAINLQHCNQELYAKRNFHYTLFAMAVINYYHSWSLFLVYSNVNIFVITIIYTNMFMHADAFTKELICVSLIIYSAATDTFMKNM